MMTWLYNSRIIAIFAVVFLHSAAGVVVNAPIGSNSWWIGNIYDSLVRWCIPVFVMISGALLLDPNKKEDLKTFYLKRLSRIFVPILFWSAFFLFWASLKGAIKGEPLGVLNLAKSLMSGKPHYHMWFLYMIVFLYLFTPFFRKVILNSSRFEIAILIFFSLFISALNTLAVIFGIAESNLFINWFLIYIPYFLLGYFIRVGDNNYSKSILWTVFSLSVFLTALGCYYVARNNGLDAGLYFYSHLSITVIPMSVSVMYLLKLWTKPIGNAWLTEKLASLTLGIYLVHPVFLETIQYRWHGYHAVNPAISIPLVSLLVFTLSLGAAWAINKIPYIKRTI
jgi:surface polysaccharide O-acyltransferase-like enzyme